MNWSHLLGWSSPIGLGVFLGGVGVLIKGLMKKMHHCVCNKEK
jgi:hypothetical protein